MTVAVLMSTYNGEKYVEEQIDSILDQIIDDGNIRLYIRDDGSTDETVKILNQYSRKYDNVVLINANNIKNLGIQKSFLSLLDYASQDEKNVYFAFADQDDVWLKEKINRGLQQIRSKEMNDKGILYYSNKSFTDEQLKLIREEKIKYYEDIFEAFLQNLASGCTMVFDRTLAGICLQQKPESNILHDSWIYHIAKQVGSTIVFDQNSYILYRQHGSNNVGIEGAQLFHSDTKFLIKRIIPLLFAKREHSILLYNSEIYRKYKNLVSEKNKPYIEAFIHYRFNPLAKFRLIHNKYMRARDIKSRLVWKYCILFNRL